MQIHRYVLSICELFAPGFAPGYFQNVSQRSSDLKYDENVFNQYGDLLEISPTYVQIPCVYDTKHCLPKQEWTKYSERL